MAIAAIDVLVDSCPIDYVMSFSVKPRKRRKEGGGGGGGGKGGAATIYVIEDICVILINAFGQRLAHNFQFSIP